MIICHCDVIGDRQVANHIQNNPGLTEKDVKSVRAELHRVHAKGSYPTGKSDSKPNGSRCTSCTEKMGECILKHLQAGVA